MLLIFRLIHYYNRLSQIFLDMNKNKLSDNQEAPSPWRTANPRRPLESFQVSPAKEGGQDFSSLNSPPNSNHKESTKLGVSQLNMSEATAASPALARSEDTLRDRREGSFTKIKGFNNSRNTSKNSSRRGSKLSKLSDSMSEDDQPSGSCQFVGDQSTINNSSLRRRGDKSLANSLSASTIDSSKVENLLNSSPPQPDKPLGSGFSLCQWLIIFSVAVPGFFAYSLYKEVGLSPLTSLLVMVPDTNTDTAEHWKLVRKDFRSDLNKIKPRFPNQSSTTWKMIGATLKAPLHPLPDYPGVLLLVSPPSATPTAHCLASQLMEVSAAALARPGMMPPHPSQLIVQAENLANLDPDTAKQQLTDKLHDTLRTWGVAGINHLEKLQPTAALTLHAFADNSNAPYTQAVMVYTLELEEEEEVQEDCNLEAKVEKQLFEVWREELGLDKFSALISRVVVSVASVRPESGAVC